MGEQSTVKGEQFGLTIEYLHRRAVDVDASEGEIARPREHLHLAAGMDSLVALAGREFPTNDDVNSCA